MPNVELSFLALPVTQCKNLVLCYATGDWHLFIHRQRDGCKVRQKVRVSRPTFVKYYSRQVRRAVYTPQVVGFADDESAITEEKEESMLAELSDDGEA